MTARLQEELAALLCDAECVSSPARREQLVWKLPSTLKHRLDVAHPPDVFARGLVHHAVSRELLGAVLRWVDTLDDASHPVRRAREAAAPLVHQEETQALAEVLGAMALDGVREVDAVRDQLVRLAYEDVKALYMNLGAGRLDSVVSPTPRNAWEALTDLSLLTLPLDGAHPLHTFCAVLARYCGGAAEAPLKKWGQEGRVGREPGSDGGGAAVVNLAGGGFEDVTSRWFEAMGLQEAPVPPDTDTDTDTDTRPPARLVVWVTHADRRGRFLLEHWAHLRDTPDGAVEFREHGQPEALPPEEIGSYVCGLITGLQRDRSIGFHSGIRVEWVVPLPLIRELRAELWQQAIAPSDSVGDQRMGARVQVVYRLAEFVGRRDEWNRAWEACGRRWARLATAGSGSLFDAHNVNGHPRLRGSDLLFQVLGDDDVAIYATGSCSHEDWFEDVIRVVAAGVPVVVWRSPRHRLRISDALGRSKGDVKTEVSLAHIRNLPVLLHRSRMQRLRRGDPGYIEDSFGLSLIFHDALPVSPPEVAPLSVSTIQYPPPGAVGRAT